MQEDKLSRDERIRLECLNQANAENMRFGLESSQVIPRAAEFERFIRDGEKK